MAIYMQSLKEEVKGEGGSFREKKKKALKISFPHVCIWQNFIPIFFPLLPSPLSFSSILVSPLLLLNIILHP